MTETFKIKHQLEEHIVASQETVLQKQDLGIENIDRLMQDIKDLVDRKRIKKDETRSLRDPIKNSI